MRKLLLIAVLALGAVACDKNELGMDMDGSSINPIEATVEVNPIDNIDIDGLISRLSSVTSKSNSKGTSTAKDANAGSSYISVYTGVIGGNLYEIAFHENSTFCDDNITNLNLFTLFYNSDGNTEFYFGDTSGTLIVTITDDLEFLFKLDLIDYGIKIDGATKELTSAVSVSNGVYTF